MQLQRITQTTGASGARVTATVINDGKEYTVDLTGTELAGVYNNPLLIPCVIAACEYGELQMEPVEEPQPEETFTQTLGRVMAHS